MASRLKIDDGTTSAAKKFSAYVPENEERTGKTIIKPNARLEKIIEAWKAYDASGKISMGLHYDNALDAVEGIDARAKDIEDFCQLLKGLQIGEGFDTTDMKSGFF